MLIIINEAKSRGIEIVPPDVNTSGIEHKVDNGKIFMTFGAIKGVGEKSANAIINARPIDKNFFIIILSAILWYFDFFYC